MRVYCESQKAPPVNTAQALWVHEGQLKCLVLSAYRELIIILPFPFPLWRLGGCRTLERNSTKGIFHCLIIFLSKEQVASESPGQRTQIITWRRFKWKLNWINRKSHCNMRINVIIAVNAQIKTQMLLLKCILTLAQGEHMLGMRAHNADRKSVV